MKKLQMIVYLILLIGIVMGYVEGFDTYKNDALACASYFNASYTFHNEYIYWEENGLCCKYALINNSIQEFCQND